MNCSEDSEANLSSASESVPFNSTGVHAERKMALSPIQSLESEENSDEKWLKEFLETMDLDKDDNCKSNASETVIQNLIKF